MKKTRMQKGITLIALIITIVVLLILAVVAIRQVTGEGILGYAKNAKDRWQRGQENEQSTLNSYFNKLNEKNTLGYMYKNGQLKIGDYIDYTPETAATSYKPDGDIIGQYTGYTEGDLQEIKQENLKWRVLGYDYIGDKLLLISSEETSETITFYSRTGFSNCINILNSTSNALYSNETLGCTARNISACEVWSGGSEEEYLSDYSERNRKCSPEC